MRISSLPSSVGACDLGGSHRAVLSLAMVPLLLALTCAPAGAQSGPGVHVLFDAGYRYPFVGQEYVPGHDAFPVTWHAATSLFVGQQLGFYAGARFDGLGPRGGHFPFAATARLGYFFDVHEYVPPRAHYSSSSRTDCRDANGTDSWVECTTTTTTRQWQTPAHFVNGIRYVYAGYRHLGFVEGAPSALTGTRPTTQAGAVALGIGFYGTKNTLGGIPYMTFLTEFEGWYHVWGLDEPSADRVRYGGSVRAAMILGPVFLDVTAALDAGFGAEISLGAGFVLGS